MGKNGYSTNLKMEAAGSSETWVFIHEIIRHILEYRNLGLCPRDHLNSDGNEPLDSKIFLDQTKNIWNSAPWI
jgi:hypothetical protein